MRIVSCLLACSLLLPVEARAQTTPVPTAAHPLDPLTGAEIALAVRLVRAQPDVNQGGELLFPTVTLHEPSKADVRGFKPGTRVPREATVVVFDRTNNRTFEALVD